jgi:hypothetical protein
MTQKDFQKVLTAFCKRSPFRPFTLELLNGSRVEVNHPEALRQQGDLLIYKSTSGIQSVFGYESVIRFIDSTGTV